MAINTSTITPLTLAAATGFMSNQGLGANISLSTQVLTYTEAYEVDPGDVGLSPNGVLGTDGVSIYDIWEENVSNVIITHTDNLGTLANIIPGGWMIDGVLYNGSLSGFGGMIAQRISPGYSPNVTYAGRYRNYLGTVTSQNLGANVLPAITQTVPSTVSGISGVMTYHLDRAVNLPMGSTSGQDLATISTVIGQASGYVQQSNMYLAAIKKAEETNLAYYGYTSYQEYITQGWLKYKQGLALVPAFTNIGTMTDSIFTGKFGTPGAVAYVLLGRDLGSVGNLEAKLIENRINTADIMNPMYDAQLRAILSSINSTDDLNTIQTTIESTIPDMSSALDYTDISRCAGRSNDSAFADFAEIGVDLYNKSPYLSIERGSDIAYIIQNIDTTVSANVEAVASTTSLLDSSITNSLRTQFPVSPTNGDLTVFDVIGSPSGYYANNVTVINTAIDELDNTAYGPKIRANLQLLVNFTNYANIILGGNVTLNTAPYYTLMSSIVANTNPTIANIVSRINSNYEYVSTRVGTETYNWNKVNMVSQSLAVNGAMLLFAQALAGYAVDSQGIGLYEYILGLVQDNETGDIVRSILAEARNYNLLNSVSQTPNGYIG